MRGGSWGTGYRNLEGQAEETGFPLQPGRVGVVQAGL